MSRTSSAPQRLGERSRRRAPTRGTMSSPRERTQAVARAATVVPFSRASARSASTRARFVSRFGPPKRGQVGADVARRDGPLLRPVPAQEAAREDAVRGDGDPELAGGRAGSRPRCRARRASTRSAGRQIGCTACARRIVVGAGLREADVAHVAGLHHLRDRADRVLDRDRGVHAGEAVDVDVVGAEPLQRVGEEVLDRGRTPVDAGPAPLDVAQRPELDAQDVGCRGGGRRAPRAGGARCGPCRRSRRCRAG